MKMYSIHLPPAWVAFIDKLVGEGLYPNRAEALRYLWREGMKKEGIWRRYLSEDFLDKVWEEEEENVVHKQEVVDTLEKLKEQVEHTEEEVPAKD